LLTLVRSPLHSPSVERLLFDLPRLIKDSWVLATSSEVRGYQLAERALVFYSLAQDGHKQLALARLIKARPSFELAAPASLKRTVDEIEKEFADPNAAFKAAFLIALALAGTGLLLYFMAMSA